MKRKLPPPRPFLPPAERKAKRGEEETAPSRPAPGKTECGRKKEKVARGKRKRSVGPPCSCPFCPRRGGKANLARKKLPPLTPRPAERNADAAREIFVRSKGKSSVGPLRSGPFRLLRNGKQNAARKKLPLFHPAPWQSGKRVRQGKFLPGAGDREAWASPRSGPFCPHRGGKANLARKKLPPLTPRPAERKAGAARKIFVRDGGKEKRGLAAFRPFLPPAERKTKRG